MSRPFGYGPTPSGWRPTKLRSLLARTKRLGQPDLPLLSVNLPSGVVLRSDNSGRPAASEDLSGYQHVKPGDLVVNQLGKPHGALGVSPYEGIISPAYFVASIAPTTEPRFVHHLLRTRLYISEYERRGKYMPPNQFDISWDQFRDIELVLPPFEIQRAIADYLDAETARIDTLITKKQRMIERVELRLQSYIEHVVRDLVSASTTKLKYMATILPGQSPPEEAYNLDGLGIPLINGPAEFQDGDWGCSTAERFTTDARVITEPGDVLICLRGSTTGRMNRTSTRSAAGRGVAAIRGLGLDNDLIFYCLLARRRELLAESTGATFMSVTTEDLGAVKVPNVSDSDALRVLSCLNRQVHVSRSMIALLGRQAALLREHRQALITAAVTGELEVPGVAA